MTPSTVLCAECDRPVADSIPLCQTCTDEFVDELMSVPGIVADIAITAARLDRMGRARNGGKSAETPLPIRIDKADLLPHRRPFDTLVNALVMWGRVIEEHYRIKIPLSAAGLRELVRTNRIGTDERQPQPEAELIRLPVYEIEQEKGKRVLAGYRIVARTPRRDPEALDTTPITPAEIVAVWLAHNPASIRLMPASHEMITDVSNAIARARMAVDRLPELRYIGPCPTRRDVGQCGAELRVEATEQWVRCWRCSEQHEVAHVLREAVRSAESDVYPMAKIAELLELMGRKVPRATLHSWHYRGRLKSRGWLHSDPASGHRSITTTWIHRNDPPVFRLGDVLRLVERETSPGSVARQSN